MNRFFTSTEVYKDRIGICKKCAYYFKPTGQCKRCLCFMKVKARLAPMECPQKYWEKTTEIEMPEDLPNELVVEVTNIWEDIKKGKAKNIKTKKRMIELYNTIHGTNYSTGTNCGSCLNSCYEGLKKIYDKYNENKFYEL